MSDAVTTEELLRHAAWARALARSLVHDVNDADDLVQETWLAALRTPPRRRRGSTKPWLATVLRNVARMRHRRRARLLRREAAAARPEAQPSHEATVVKLELQRWLADAVLALREPTRTTLVQHFHESLSCVEIARREGVPAATVRSRVRRGLEQLRERLDAEHDGARAGWLPAMCLLTGAGAGDVSSARSRDVRTAGFGVLAAASLLLLAMLVPLTALVVRGGPEEDDASRTGPETAASHSWHRRASDAAAGSGDVGPRRAARPTRGRREPEGRAGVADGDDAVEAPSHLQNADVVVTVTDERGEPLEDVLVYLLVPGIRGDLAEDGLGDVPHAWTDDAGRCGLVDVEGEWQLGLRSDAHVTRVQEVRLTEGARLRYTLRAGALVRGRVVCAATRKPIADADLRVTRRPPAGRMLWALPGVGRRGRDLREVRTDAAGRFEYRVEAGHFRAELTRPGFIDAVKDLRAPSAGAELRMVPLTPLEFVVEDWPHGRRERLMATLVDAATDACIGSIGHGSFGGSMTHTPGLPPGDYRIEALVQGLGMGTRRFSVAATGASLRVALRLTPLATLRVTVDGGAPSGYLAVHAPDGNWNSWGPLTAGSSRVTGFMTRAEGRVELQCEPGRYGVTFFSGSRVSQLAYVDAAAAEESVVRLETVESVRLAVPNGARRIRVLGRDGEARLLHVLERTGRAACRRGVAAVEAASIYVAREADLRLVYETAAGGGDPAVTVSRPLD